MILECCCRNDYFAAHQMLDMHIHIHLISYLLFKTSWTLAICKAFYATWSWGAKSSKSRHISFNIFLPWDFSKTYLNFLMLHNYKILCSLIICQCASAFWLGLIIPIISLSSKYFEEKNTTYRWQLMRNKCNLLCQSN